MNSHIRAGDIAAECHGVKVPVSPFVPGFRVERINRAEYEGQEIAGGLAAIREGDRVLEMGAGLGLVGAVVTLKGRAARLLSYEANPALIPHIRDLYALNGIADRAEVRNQVLIEGSDRTPTATFHLGRSYLGSSLVETGTSVRSVEVPTRELSEVVADYRPDFVLMDIEGGELEALKVFDLSGVRGIVIEFHPEVYGREGMQACKAAITQAGLRKLDAHSTRKVWTCVRPD